MMPTRKKIEYEKIKTDDFVIGTIESIPYEKEHVWKPFQGTTRDPGEAVRFVFSIDGYKFQHKTPWLTFSYGAKSKLYQKYLISLVENAKPDMQFDIENLVGMRVKMLWVDNGDFQAIETIRPLDGKIKAIGTSTLVDMPVSEINDAQEEVPF